MFDEKVSAKNASPSHYRLELALSNTFFNGASSTFAIRLLNHHPQNLLIHILPQLPRNSLQIRQRDFMLRVGIISITVPIVREQRKGVCDFFLRTALLTLFIFFIESFGTAFTSHLGFPFSLSL